MEMEMEMEMEMDGAKEITKVEGEWEERRRGQRKNERAVLSERGLGVEKKQLGKKTIAVQASPL